MLNACVQRMRSWRRPIPWRSFCSQSKTPTAWRKPPHSKHKEMVNALVMDVFLAKDNVVGMLVAYSRGATVSRQGLNMAIESKLLITFRIALSCCPNQEDINHMALMCLQKDDSMARLECVLQRGVTNTKEIIHAAIDLKKPLELCRILLGCFPLGPVIIEAHEYAKANNCEDKDTMKLLSSLETLNYEPMQRMIITRRLTQVQAG